MGSEMCIRDSTSGFARNMADDGDPADVTPTAFDDLPLEMVELVVRKLVDDLCCGVSSLVLLSRCCRRLYNLVTRAELLARCAAQYYGARLVAAVPVTFALLGVLETCAGLGTTRIYFSRSKASVLLRPDLQCGEPVIRPGSSMPRLVELALLLRRHPQLTVVVEGHEGMAEGTVVQASEDGHQREMRASSGASVARCLLYTSPSPRDS